MYNVQATEIRRGGGGVKGGPKGDQRKGEVPQNLCGECRERLLQLTPPRGLGLTLVVTCISTAAQRQKFHCVSIDPFTCGLIIPSPKNS